MINQAEKTFDLRQISYIWQYKKQKKKQQYNCEKEKKKWLKRLKEMIRAGVEAERNIKNVVENNFHFYKRALISKLFFALINLYFSVKW